MRNSFLFFISKFPISDSSNCIRFKMINMKLRYWCLSLLLIVLNTGCLRLENHINFYFDASGAFNLDKLSVVIMIDDQTILDTVIENAHTNKSVFIKSLTYKIHRKDMVSVVINGKKMVVGNLGAMEAKCADIFLGYDDHSLILKELSKIEAEKGALSNTEGKRLYDSIKISSGKKYDLILVDMKEGACNKM